MRFYLIIFFIDYIWTHAPFVHINNQFKVTKYAQGRKQQVEPGWHFVLSGG